MSTEIYSDHLCQLLEAASHHIIGKRKIYPDIIFTQRLAFGVPVIHSFHPGVNDFIEQALDSLMHAIDARKAAVLGLDLLIFDKDQDVAEKYVFRFPRTKFKYKDKRGVFTAKEKFKAPLDVADVLRNILIKLTQRMNDLPPLENAEDCTFNYSMVTNVAGAKAIEGKKPDFPWQAKTYYLDQSDTDQVMEFQAEKIPIQSGKHNPLNISLHIDKFK